MVKKSLYNPCPPGRNHGRVLPLYRHAHDKNPYAPLVLHDDDEEQDEEASVGDSTVSEPERRSSPRKAAGQKKKPTPRIIANNDDGYLDEQIKANKNAAAARPIAKVPAQKSKVNAKVSAKSTKKVPPASKNSPKRGNKCPVVEERADFDTLANNKEGQRISSAKVHASSSKNSEINDLKARLAEMNDENEILQARLEHREKQLSNQEKKNKTISTKLDEANHYIEDSHHDFVGQHTMEVSASTMSTIKKQVAKAFREVKFINNDDGMFKFGDMIMDMMGDINITHDPKDSREEKLQVEENRKIFRRSYGKYMRHCLNEHRNGVQVMSCLLPIPVLAHIFYWPHLRFWDLLSPY